MAAFHVDLSQLPAADRERLRALWAERDRVHHQRALERQRLAKKFYDAANRPGSTHAALGPLTMVVDPYFQSLWRRQHGDTIDQDPDFPKWLARREEERAAFLLKPQTTKISVGWTPPADRKRFQKTYA